MALAQQGRRSGRARRRADAVKLFFGRQLRFGCIRGTAGGFAGRGRRAGPFMGSSEAAQQQCYWWARRCPERVSSSLAGGGLPVVSLQTRQQDMRPYGKNRAENRHLLKETGILDSLFRFCGTRWGSTVGDRAPPLTVACCSPPPI